MSRQLNTQATTEKYNGRHPSQRLIEGNENRKRSESRFMIINHVSGWTIDEIEVKTARAVIMVGNFT